MSMVTGGWGVEAGGSEVQMPSISEYPTITYTVKLVERKRNYNCIINKCWIPMVTGGRGVKAGGCEMHMPGPNKPRRFNS